MDPRIWTGAITRRRALRALGGLAAGVPLATLCRPVAWAGDDPIARSTGRPQAKAVIEIWMSGGPSHIDTFDPKPEAGYDFCGPLDTALPTNVDGIRLGRLLPRLAQHADKYSLIRSLTHGVNGHETATYITQTGRTPGDERLVYPGLGAIVASLRGQGHDYEGLIPPYVVLTRPLGRFSPTGFLGPRQKPFVTGGDPNRRVFAVEGIVAPGITTQRQGERRKLLHDLDALGDALPDHPRLRQLDECEDRAYDLILGDAGKLFDLSREKTALRDRYGRNTLGQSCLMARRLVEHGVPYITIHSGGWDTHKQHFQSMNRMLPQLDAGVATLLEDLAARGLLDSTVVWCCGEFGRTPRVSWDPPWNGGRGHFGAVFSALVAGGGFHGGHVVGASDAKAMAVRDRPVHPRDLLGSICELLGIDPDSRLPNPRGLDVRVMPGSSTSDRPGRLTEIMG